MFRLLGLLAGLAGVTDLGTGGQPDESLHRCVLAARLADAAGCDPDEMGIGPVFAVPILLAKAGLSLDDIDVVELNEAFASQLLYCQRELEIPDAKLNPLGGSISIGHPYGMTGSRMTAQLLSQLRRTGGKRGIVTMCVGGGMGAAGLFEAR